MNSLDGYTFCTLCSQYTPEGTACSDPDCPVVDADPSTQIADVMDEVEPINFRRLEDLRGEDYTPVNPDWIEDGGYPDPYYDLEDSLDPDYEEDRDGC